MANDTGYHEYGWMTSDRWYNRPGEATFNFLVLRGFNAVGVNEASALDCFGDPQEEHRVANYKVLVWNKRLPVKY